MGEERDKTMWIFKEALQKGGTPEDEAERVVRRAESNAEIMAEFEVMKAELQELAKVSPVVTEMAQGFIKLKKAGAAVAALVLTNYGIDIAQGVGLVELLIAGFKPVGG